MTEIPVDVAREQYNLIMPGGAFGYVIRDGTGTHVQYNNLNAEQAGNVVGFEVFASDEKQAYEQLNDSMKEMGWENNGGGTYKNGNKTIKVGEPTNMENGTYRFTIKEAFLS